MTQIICNNLFEYYLVSADTNSSIIHEQNKKKCSSTIILELKIKELGRKGEQSGLNVKGFICTGYLY